MKILIYIPSISQDWGGVRQYSATLLTMLSEDHDNHYFIYHDVDDPEIIDSIKNITNKTLVNTEEINKSNNKNIVILYRTINYFLKKIRINKKIIIHDNLSSFVIKNSIQIIHCPWQFIPSISGVKLITTLHDVQELHFPEFFSAENRAYRAKSYLDFLRRSDTVIVSYEHVKKDLIKYFKVPEEKIKVILLQMNKLWFNKYINQEAIKLPEKLENTRFVFYPANTWEHKNHIALLEAIANLRDKENIIVNLISTGSITVDHGEKVTKRVFELNLCEQVQLLGVVNEQLLYSIYKNAVGVVIPTLYEAGSFPLMESIILGIPVICSNVTSLPETIGNSDYVFDPKNIESIKNKLKQLWLDESFRVASLANSLIQKQRLIEPNSLTKIINTYSEIIND